MRLDPVPPGVSPELTDDLARYPGPVLRKNELREDLDSLGKRMDELQTALFAESKRALLVVLQARDSGGKDSTIRRVFGYLNPQGCLITGFKAPTPVELSHDFLWRAHYAVPPKGYVGVFNRSHYEDVLVVRVHGLVPESVWRPRYEQINAFEQVLIENGIAIRKFFLHVSRDEQRARLRDRLGDPSKYWKFNPGDLGERDRWEDYTRAYQEMMARTSTPAAPWFVVPADRKLPRDILVARTVVDTLESLDPKFPGPPRCVEEFARQLA
jgi:PPK2 family polyphosphate:nucleotide phosphotransferase